jgi:hypothetical protein
VAITERAKAAVQANRQIRQIGSLRGEASTKKNVVGLAILLDEDRALSISATGDSGAASADS